MDYQLQQKLHFPLQQQRYLMCVVVDITDTCPEKDFNIATTDHDLSLFKSCLYITDTKSLFT